MSSFAESGTVLESRFLRTYYTAYSRVKFESVCARAGSLRELTADAPADLADSPYFIGSIFPQMLLGNLVHPPTAIVRRQRLREAGGFENEVTAAAPTTTTSTFASHSAARSRSSTRRRFSIACTRDRSRTPRPSVKHTATSRSSPIGAGR